MWVVKHVIGLCQYKYMLFVHKAFHFQYTFIKLFHHYSFFMREHKCVERITHNHSVKWNWMSEIIFGKYMWIWWTWMSYEDQKYVIDGKVNRLNKRLYTYMYFIIISLYVCSICSVWHVVYQWCLNE